MVIRPERPSSTIKVSANQRDEDDYFVEMNQNLQGPSESNQEFSRSNKEAASERRRSWYDSPTNYQRASVFEDLPISLSHSFSSTPKQTYSSHDTSQSYGTDIYASSLRPVPTEDRYHERAYESGHSASYVHPSRWGIREPNSYPDRKHSYFYDYNQQLPLPPPPPSMQYTIPYNERFPSHPYPTQYGYCYDYNNRYPSSYYPAQHNNYQQSTISQSDPYQNTVTWDQVNSGYNSFIHEIHKNDVLCGRGGLTNHHDGNRSFRKLVKEYQERYIMARKKDKLNVAEVIVNAVRNLNPPGRFLKKDKANGYWYDIGNEKAKEKASQALREGAARIRGSILSASLTENATDVQPASRARPLPPSFAVQHTFEKPDTLHDSLMETQSTEDFADFPRIVPIKDTEINPVTNPNRDIEKESFNERPAVPTSYSRQRSWDISPTQPKRLKPSIALQSLSVDEKRTESNVAHSLKYEPV